MAQKTGQNAIKYSIITAFSKKGLDAAEKGLKKLRASFKKTSLASKLTFAALGAGLTALAAKSIAAAREQDKLQRKLEFSLKTLGETTAIPSVNRFLDVLERQTGVANETLVPAFMSLARVTNQITDAYDALNLALDISAITGDDVATIADAMAKGFAGNATALSKLIPGLDKAAVKAGDMQAIMARLNKEFGGAATGTMDSYASKLAKLRVSVQKSLEILGTGLINFLQGLTKTSNVEDLGVAIEKFARKVSYILEGLPVGIRTFLSEMKKSLESNIIGRFLLNVLGKIGKGFEKAADAAAEYGYYANERRMGGFGPRLWETANTEKWSKTVIKTVNTIRKVNFRNRLAEMFDLERAALAAAKLNGQLSKEEQARVEALQALKTEQETDDEKYYKTLLGLSADATAKLIADQNSLAANLKKQLDAQLEAYNDMFNKMQQRYTTGFGPGGTVVTVPKDFGVPQMQNPIVPPVVPPPPPPIVPPPAGADSTSGIQYGTYGPTGNINVNVSAGVIADEDRLKYIIADEIVKYVRYGGTLAPAGFI